MDAKLAHLQMIQDVISRMGLNSFHLKGWSVTLVSALLALAAAKTQLRFVSIALLPVIAFWLLDGYFLRQERLFRKLYDHVRAIQPGSIDFSMDTSTFTVASWLDVCRSKTLLVFHGAIFGAVVVVMFIAITRS